MNTIGYVLCASFLAACVTEVPEARSVSTEVAAPVARNAGRVPFAGLGAPGYVVAQRERDAIAVWAEGLDGGRWGETVRVAARHVIGDLALAVSGEHVLVAWAQGEPVGCTSLFGFVWQPGDSSSEAQRIGERCTEETSARSPSASGADNGSFVIGFTELGVWSSTPASLTVNPKAPTKVPHDAGKASRRARPEPNQRSKSS